jgi:hypothetical protein
MEPNQNEIYSKFLLAVVKNRAEEVFELLETHNFLKAELDKPVPGLDKSPLMVTLAQPEYPEVAKVLRAFGANTQTKEELSKLGMRVSDTLGAVLAQPPEALMKTVIEERLYHQASLMLYILTGRKPALTNGMYSCTSDRALHFRFILNAMSESNEILKLSEVLTAFSLQHFSGLHKPQRQERYVTVPLSEISKIQALFLSSGTSQTCPMLFSPLERADFEQIRIRNNGKYRLENLARLFNIKDESHAPELAFVPSITPALKNSLSRENGDGTAEPERKRRRTESPSL